MTINPHYLLGHLCCSHLSRWRFTSHTWVNFNRQGEAKAVPSIPHPNPPPPTAALPTRSRPPSPALGRGTRVLTDRPGEVCSTCALSPGALPEQNAQPTSRRRTRSVPAVPSPPARHQPPLHQTTLRSRRRGERAPGPPVTLGPHHPPRPGASPARGGATAGGSARGRRAGLVARGTEIKLRFRGKEWGGGRRGEAG